MLGFIRLGVFGFLGLCVLYLMVAFYSRSVRREKLENQAAEQIAEGTLEVTGYEAFIENGMREYEGSLRRKLIVGVFIVPVVAVLVLIYVTNFT
ncbi:hypothetical protein [Actibacterium lipolyticum]|uniref:Uncharacterized protein n=1 Tax=Actibacterium lipolyticum TaxID=1524263 RepID=A0A238JN07_9RHOB|nr:hypothetical protein [Actibacterium lipolyticum]SMX31875.1 hypothetical protein COL8621_00635 [Actibacterium lipolyticum]